MPEETPEAAELTLSEGQSAASPGQAEMPLVLYVSLGFPAFCVVIWFLARIFNGQWIDPAA